MPKKTSKVEHDIDNDPAFSITREGANEMRLVQFLERIERLAEEKQGIADDMKDVFAEAKSTGFDTKTMRRMITLRKLDNDARNETLSLEQTYMDELGISI